MELIGWMGRMQKHFAWLAIYMKAADYVGIEGGYRVLDQISICYLVST